ncbi:protein of unknown function [Streptomyces murinus]
MTTLRKMLNRGSLQRTAVFRGSDGETQWTPHSRKPPQERESFSGTGTGSRWGRSSVS